MSVILKQYDILLDIKRATTNNKIEVVEGDNGNIFHITLTDNNEPVDLSDTRVVAVFSNSDGTAEQDTGDTAYGEYVFTYDSVTNHWNESVLRGSDDITYFGITLTGTPSNGDKITVTYDENGATATTTVSGGSVSVNTNEFVRSMASVLILGDDNNEVYILVHAGSFSSSGINECELQVYSGKDMNEILVTTAKFNFQSRRSSLNDETIQSEEKFPILISTLAEASQALAKANQFTLPPTATASTLLPNESATAGVSLLDSGLSFVFGIPKGDKGDTGATGQAWYVHIKYSHAQPTSDADIGDTADDWIGIYSGTSSSAPATYTSYTWFEYKGDKGDTGNTGATGNGIASIAKTATAGLVDTYTITYTNGNTTTFTVTNGQNGQGSPSSATPKPLGTAAAGSSTEYSRGDHIHKMPSASDVGAVPTTRTVNGNALSSNIVLDADDIGTDSVGVSVQDAIDTLSAKTALYFTSVACSAMTGDFATVSNAAITADHVVAQLTFSDPWIVKENVTWTTTNGQLVLNGTCYSASITANIVLIKKDN